ncbi:erythromycin esterase family protein [Streptomyces sp. NPDC058193]|uniref:erythromycin esterase family protein n=1 Tax=Streptomyces sp. NPDC058193 TaxID=3346373 RepID=UPI0036E8E36C
MPTPFTAAPFTDWLSRHAVPLTRLAPDAPLDDLEPLRDIIGDARVVGIGEHSHFIEEFSLLRRRLLRYLVEHCGFTVLGFEYGFSEGIPLDTWARGGGTDDDLAAHLATAVPVGISAPLRWVRRHNRTASSPVRFAGIDIPAAGGSLLPALEPVARYLRRVDPETLPALETVMRTAASFAGGSAAVAAPAWARLPAADRDALTSALSRLLVRFRSLEPLYLSRGDRSAYDLALHQLEGALHGDYTFRAMAGLFAGDGLTADTSARDAYMARSVLWHLDHFPAGTRIVLAAHNAHIQKAPLSFDGHLTGLPMGQQLDRALGEDYFALGLTSIAGHTAEMRRDEKAPFGFTVTDTALEPPETGSIEAAVAETGSAPGIADLRRARAEVSDGPDRIRLQSTFVRTPVLDAFDGVLTTRTSTVTADLAL